jgi:hypothetical protein
MRFAMKTGIAPEYIHLDTPFSSTCIAHVKGVILRDLIIMKSVLCNLESMAFDHTSSIPLKDI